MKSQSKNRQSASDNRRYSIGAKDTPIGTAKHVVWSNLVIGIIEAPHMIGVKLYGGETIWCRDTDEGVQQLIKDRRRSGGKT